jgi:hypothetical protein
MIKKRKGWYRHIKPSGPVCPRKPEKVVRREKTTVVYEASGWSVSLSDVPLPEGVSLSDLHVSASADGDGDITFEFCLREECEEENPTYDREMKYYEKAYAQYKERRDEFKAELAEWKAWNAEQDAVEVKARLEAAERLLRQHGRLPGGPSVG